jgi:hypothetical protein
MEDSFVGLLYGLGYTVTRRCDIESGLDVIAKFYGELINPTTTYPCKLMLPSFAPKGLTAFSLKRGDFTNKDVTELIEKVEKAKSSHNEVLNSLESRVMATNFFKVEGVIDDMLAKDVYCWDGRRLFFYSAKARVARELGSRGPTNEIAVEGIKNSSYLIETETSKKLENVLLANVVVFVDDHSKELVISSDHIEKILKFVYERSLKGIIEYVQLETQTLLEIHVLGIANEELVRSTYNRYATETALHPKVFFSAEPVVFQYGAAPWATLFSRRLLGTMVS